MDIEIRRTSFETEEELWQLVELQNVVYQERGLHFTVDGFRFWYIDNPLGRVVAFGAFENDKMIAHYACIPTQMKISGKVVNGLLSMAVVTHPMYRGQGLFKTLAKCTYDLAGELGYEFVVGVANANSFPGFMKYFPFTYIGQLEVKWGWGEIVLPDKPFSHFWSIDTLQWRLNKKKYTKGQNAVYGVYGNYPFIKTFMGVLPKCQLDKLSLRKTDYFGRPLNLYVGMGADLSRGHYFNVPGFIKHSPFNLRFMDLTVDKHLPVPNKDNIVFQLIDFDVA